MTVSRSIVAVFHAASRHSAIPFARHFHAPSLSRPIAPSLPTASTSSNRPRYPGLTSRPYSVQYPADLATEVVRIDEEIDANMPSTACSGTKRKRTDSAFFAVRKGRTPGIYASWPDCQEQIGGFSGAEYKKFTSRAEAEAYIGGRARSAAPTARSGSIPRPSSKAGGSKFYGVQAGHHPGVYTDYNDVQNQCRGFPGARQQRFATREEAQAYVDADKGATPGTTPAPAYPSGYTTAATSTKDDTGVEGSLLTEATGANAREPKVRESAQKKRKKNDGIAVVTMENGEIEPGTGPLPPDAEDNFDRTIILRPDTGKVEYKTKEELEARVWQPTGEFTGTLRIYTDGASRGNGQVGAYAGIGVYFGPNNPNNVAAPLDGARQTNQRAELAAIKRAVDLAPIDRTAHIISDSNYSINCVTKWFQTWRKSDWRNSSGKPVENRDLIEPILDRINERYMAGAKTTFEWVKGHASDAGNIEADRLAVAGAEIGRRLREEGEGRKEEEKRLRRMGIGAPAEPLTEEDQAWADMAVAKREEEEQTL